MKTNEKGLTLIKRFEGLRLEAYQDVVGIWTIGYGHTRTAKPGMKITEREAEALLREDLREAERTVARLVQIPLSSNEFSALVSLVFNIGPGAFARSTVLRLLNKGDRTGAAEAFKMWNRAGGRIVAGLTNRREAEQRLFLEHE